MRLAILDYQAGNSTSVLRALAHLGYEGAVITADPAVVDAAERVIFPGVGAAGSCMANLRAAGLDAALRRAVAGDKPVLGICVGMQLLFEHSDEDGGTPCLGLLPGTVRRFTGGPGLKVPHMGWNPLRFVADDPLFRGLEQESSVYFVHSYHCVPAEGVERVATSEHGERFCAGVRRGNLAAVQFHPEKSGPVGLRLLQNFLA